MTDAILKQILSEFYDMGFEIVGQIDDTADYNTLTRKHESCADYILFTHKTNNGQLVRFQYTFRRTFSDLENCFVKEELNGIVHLQNKRYTLSLHMDEFTEKSDLEVFLENSKSEITKYVDVIDIKSLNEFVNEPFNNLEYLWMPPKWFYKIKIADLAGDVLKRNQIFNFTIAHYEKQASIEPSNLKNKLAVDYLRKMEKMFCS